MADTNKYIAEATTGMQSPITFDSGIGGNDNKGAVQQLIDLVSLEATEANVPRLFLDEMSPTCRDSLIVVLTALQGAVVNAA